jgi:hypothetical protein
MGNCVEVLGEVRVDDFRVALKHAVHDGFNGLVRSCQLPRRRLRCLVLSNSAFSVYPVVRTPVYNLPCFADLAV